MKTAACLVLILSGQLVPINKPFPTEDSCERAGFSMTDGQTVKGYSCLPRIIVDGLPVYDCGRYQDIDLTPPPAGETCIVDSMTDGTVISRHEPCVRTATGWRLVVPRSNVIDVRPTTVRPPIPKYQKRME